MPRPEPTTRLDIIKRLWKEISQTVKYYFPLILTVILLGLIIAGFITVVKDEIAYQKTIAKEFEYGK